MLGSARKAVFVLVPTGRGGWDAIPFLRSCRGTRRTRTLRFSLLRCGERPGGHLMSLPEGIATPAVRGMRLGASGGAVSSVVTSGCPKRSEGGFPVGTRTVTSASSAQQEEICGAPPLLSEGRNEGEHRGNHDGGSAGCARHGLDLLIPGRWGRRRCSGCPGRPQHRGRSSCCPVGGL